MYISIYNSIYSNNKAVLFKVEINNKGCFLLLYFILISKIYIYENLNLYIYIRFIIRFHD